MDAALNKVSSPKRYFAPGSMMVCLPLHPVFAVSDGVANLQGLTQYLKSNRSLQTAEHVISIADIDILLHHKDPSTEVFQEHQDDT